MSSMKDATETILQAKVFDFALTELVYRHRDSFQPLWTIDSWVKFLIWMALNCGLSGDKKSLELFADSLGHPLTSRMRRIFFERTIESLSIRLIADPAESQVLLMSADGSNSVDFAQAEEALIQVGLQPRIVLEKNLWKEYDDVIAIPWQSNNLDG